MNHSRFICQIPSRPLNMKIGDWAYIRDGNFHIGGKIKYLIHSTNSDFYSITLQNMLTPYPLARLSILVTNTTTIIKGYQTCEELITEHFIDLL